MKVIKMDVSEFKNIYPKLIGHSYFIGKHNASESEYINHNDDIIVYCGYGGNYINPKIKVNSFFEQFIKKNLEEYEFFDNYISIQYRNTDKKNDPNLIVSKIKQHLIKIKRNNISNIFLATDDQKSINVFKKLLPEFKIFSVCKFKFFSYYFSIFQR